MKTLLCLTGFFAGLSIGAFAGPVTYSTNTSQLCLSPVQGCGVASQTVGGVNISFSPVVNSTVNPNPTTISSFGEIVVSCVGGGTACASQSLVGLNLFINITQTVPSVGTGAIPAGVVVGTISGNASSATISWTTANTSVGGVSYRVLNTPLGLVPPSTNGGVTTIQALITDVPEPSTYLMLSGALAGLGLLRRQRR